MASDPTGNTDGASRNTDELERKLDDGIISGTCAPGTEDVFE